MSELTQLRTKLPLIAVAGSPNTGKTTLFNKWTQSRAKVGNYPGVTVERRKARTQVDGLGTVEVIDVPGTYSLTARTSEEQIAVDALLGLHGNPRPDVAVICADATKLSRSLYLVLQAKELQIPVVLALTMNDDIKSGQVDVVRLRKELDCPVVALVAPRGRGLDELGKAVAEEYGKASVSDGWHWKPDKALEADIKRVVEVMPETWPKGRAIGLWALMSVSGDDELQGIPDQVRRAVAEAKLDGTAIDEQAIRGRYAFIDDLLGKLDPTTVDHSWTERVDKILVNRFAGFAVFLAIMFLVFQSLFAWSDPAITLIEDIFGVASEWVEGALGPGIFTEFLTGGVIGGVGSVVVFLPQILLLFLFIGIMEASGYMARVAYLMDRIMKSMNLHGRAFVPMLSGFACAVPAILATRTLERRRDRLLTMMVVPLMTCSARLPIYTLLIAALFPAGHVLGIFPVQGLLMVAMYLFSVVIALIAAWVMSRVVKQLKAPPVPFVIELPPYRMPDIKSVLGMMWHRTSFFLKEAGTVILACTIVLWALLSFPRDLDQPDKDYAALIEAAETDDARAALEAEEQGERLRNSYGGRLGKLIEPAIEPLGFDWKIGIGIIGAFAAREVFISTMGVVYSVGDEVDEESATLRESIRAEKRRDGTTVYTPLVGLSLMIFFALACQCMSTLAVVKRETGGYKWPLFLFGYMTVLAWVMSFIVYQGGRLLGFS
ncbi:MAG: ferrous iron transport protein B [Deltaproteobacteria bacterium]|nr:ferrous iron transport protein B [Deltaproteobacteria bacterium]